MKNKTKARDIPGQPQQAEFVAFAQSKGIDEAAAAHQWEIWDLQDWCDGNGTPIINWKVKLYNYARNGFSAFRDCKISKSDLKAAAYERQMREYAKRNRQDSGRV